MTHQPVRALGDLANDVRALGLPTGIERSLLAKIDSAAAALGRRDGSRLAARHLALFEREVRAKSPTPIPASQAADLLEFSTEIETLLR